MARCAVCFKKDVMGRNVSHSAIKTPRIFRANLHKFHGKTYCTKCLRALKKEIAVQEARAAKRAANQASA